MRLLRITLTLLALLIGFALLYQESDRRVLAQCSTATAQFAGATHVELHPDPLPGYVFSCYDLSGNLLTISSAQVPAPGLVMVNFASPQTGKCVVK